MSCLGADRRERGQNLVPLPPAKITACMREDVISADARRDSGERLVAVARPPDRALSEHRPDDVRREVVPVNAAKRNE